MKTLILLLIFVLPIYAQVSASIPRRYLILQSFTMHITMEITVTDTLKTKQYKRDFIMVQGDTAWYYIKSWNFFENEAMTRIYILVSEMQKRIEYLEMRVQFLEKRTAKCQQ